ncbi:sporulation protein YpjB [Rossellomorea sp. SC111]|uniref:sporulation protein YpjB n=1 Tax=Rossellomorea sp. SC111 TaxID=2968985 RepID=UPI00215A3127|nr:sporulation protein YpjB [Rossellomorea sp. SC111]MCR8846927.1 sporulation protein YpjB [Rossellomorea sp. SC111]
MKLIQFFITLFLFLILVPHPLIAVESPSPINELDEISDQALQMTKAGRYEEAKHLLVYFSEEFASLSAQQSFSMDELRILTISHNLALESINQSSLALEERVNAVTKFRLVMDALNSQHQPLWVEMEDPIMEAFNGVKVAAENGNVNEYQTTLNVFLSKYNIIQPSIKLDIPVERAQSLDARITYLDHYRQDVLEGEQTMSELTALETDLQNLFENMTEDEADPSLWWVIISTGSIIVSTLSYVGWRKYKGQGEVKKSERQKN